MYERNTVCLELLRIMRENCLRSIYIIYNALWGTHKRLEDDDLSDVKRDLRMKLWMRTRNAIWWLYYESRSRAIRVSCIIDLRRILFWNCNDFTIITNATPFINANWCQFYRSISSGYTNAIKISKLLVVGSIYSRYRNIVILREIIFF